MLKALSVAWGAQRSSNISFAAYNVCPDWVNSKVGRVYRGFRITCDRKYPGRIEDTRVNALCLAVAVAFFLGISTDLYVHRILATGWSSNHQAIG
jgi:hypothetical protein